MFKQFFALCASLLEIQFGSDSFRLVRLYLREGEYMIGNRETKEIGTLTIQYSREKTAMIWRFQSREIELVDDGSLRSFRANTLPPVKVNSRDAIQGLEVRSNTQTQSTYILVSYNEDEHPYFLQFEANEFKFEGWMIKKRTWKETRDGSLD